MINIFLGKGNTNDGSAAQGFFNNLEKNANITGIKLNLIQRFSNILSTIASGFEVNLEAFDAKLFVNLYLWYYMPPNVHNRF